MVNNKRRSLGTKKLEGHAAKPMAVSSQDRENGGQVLATPSTFKRQPLTKIAGSGDPGASRLPRSRFSGRPSEVNKGRRSTSQSAGSHLKPPTALRTPRSLSSSGRTPRSGARGYMGAPPNNRLSMLGGSGRKSDAGRLSTIGTKNKMHDKVYQKEVEREIIAFCLANGYPNINLTLKSFPLSSTEFKAMFVFLIRFIHPEFKELGPGFEAEVPVILKETLGYSAHVSKPTFQTLGTIHSWPAVLSCLYYVYNMAKFSAEVEAMENNELEYINLDEDGFKRDVPSMDEMKFDCFFDMYKQFNEGAEDFGPSIDAYEARLIDVEGVDPQEIAAKDAELESLEHKANKLQHVRSSVHADAKRWQDKLQDLLSDRESLTLYNRKSKLIFENRLKELENLKDSIENKLIKIETLTRTVSDLRDVCLHEKKIDPDNDARVTMEITRLEEQIQVFQSKVEDSTKTKWQVEMDQSKLVSDCENVCLAFNRELIAMGICDSEDDDVFKLDPQTPLPLLRQFMHKLSSDLRAEDRSSTSACSGLERDVHCETKDVMVMRSDRDKIREGLEVKCREFKRLKQDIDDSGEQLTGLLDDLRDALHNLKEMGRRDIDKQEKELQELKKQWLHAKRQREEDRAALHDLLQKTAEAIKLKRQRQLEVADRYLESYTVMVDRKIAEIEKQNQQIKQVCNVLPKPK